MAVQKFTLTGTMNHPITGLPLDGYILVVPSNELVDTVEGIIFPPLGYQVPVSAGVVNPGGEITIPYTDNADIAPSGWSLVFTERFSGMTQKSYAAFVPASMGGQNNIVNITALVELASPPAVVQYVISGQPLTISGTPSANQVLTALTANTADWQNVQGGGGAVSSVFTRSGAVTAQQGDYAAFYDALGAATTAQTNAQNFTTTSINSLNLGTASTHAAGDFDTAGSANTAQANAISTSSTNTTNAINALSLGTKSKQNSTGKYGLLAVVVEPEDCLQSGGSTLTSGFQICNLIRPDGPISIADLGIWITTAGVTASGYNGLALYTEAGVLIDQTPDLSTAFATTGYIQNAFNSILSYNTQANTSYYLSVLSHFSGTAPKAASKIAGQVIPVINGHYFSISKSGVATFPANFTPSTYTTSTASYCMGVS